MSLNAFSSDRLFFLGTRSSSPSLCFNSALQLICFSLFFPIFSALFALQVAKSQERCCNNSRIAKHNTEKKRVSSMNANICPKESWDFLFIFIFSWLWQTLFVRENIMSVVLAVAHNNPFSVWVSTAEFWLWLRGETKSRSLLFTLTTQSSWWQHLIRTPTSGRRREEGIVGVLCIRTQNPLEGLLIPAGLETPRDPPRMSLEDVAGASLLSLLPPQLRAVRVGQKKQADRLPRTTKGTVRVLEWRFVDRRC